MMSHTVSTVAFFDGTNYGYWKACMRLLLKSLKVWFVVESGWTALTKPTTEWYKLEKEIGKANDKTMNALSGGVSQGELFRISNCDSVKEVWDILETTYEGMLRVKSSKLQLLASQFDSIRMLEDETFNNFYGKLVEIRNSMVCLGKKVSNTKLIKRILRFLPERFNMKVTAIEESRNVETMKLEELVGNLQTFEFKLDPPKKAKSIALKTLVKNSNDFSNEKSPNDEELAFIAKMFYKHKHRIVGKRNVHERRKRFSWYSMF
jgi:hypothetical protein